MEAVLPAWEQLLESDSAHGHAVQLYDADEQALTRNVGNYLWRGFERGEGLLVIATKAHRRAFERQLRALGVNLGAAIARKQLVFLDAAQTLARFMLEGSPDWDLFESVIRAELHTVRPLDGSGGLRAYGEMVGLLWIERKFSAAIRLEEFWNKLLASTGCKLFCSYPIDIFGEDFENPSMQDLLRCHTHLVPCGPDGDVEAAISRAMDDVLGAKAEGLRIRVKAKEITSGIVIPAAEAAILSLRRDLPAEAGAVLTRARQYYQSEKRFRALVENSSDAISLTNPNGAIVYASASTCKVLGYRPEELTGRNVFEFIHSADIGAARRLVQEVLAKPRCPAQMEIRILRKDGSWCWVESTTNNLLDEPDIRAIVSNYRDIGERKAAEERKQRDAEELARSNAQLQAFAYAAAHDLKEPLRTVCAFTQLLVREGHIDQAGQELAGFVVDGVNRMTMLLDDLLTFARLTFDGPPGRVQLANALHQARQNLDHAIRECNAHLEVSSLPDVLADETHLVQLFQNLIGNALKYCGPAPVQIHITAERLGPEWIVKVRDNGIGIAPEYHDRIFGLFKRLHGQDIPGTGIGLAICKKIVEGMGGRIWVESEFGKGSTFCFTVAAA